MKLRQTVLDLTRAPLVSRAAQSAGAVRELALSYFAGELITDALFEAERLRRQGLDLSFTYLAQSEEALETNDELVKLLEAMGERASGVELSLRPSTLGLRSDPALAAAKLRDLCQHAADRGALVTLEMQGPADVDPTLDLFRGVRPDFPDLGITLPVNLRRAAAALPELAREGNRVRVCIGSYPASPSEGVQDEHAKSLALVAAVRDLMASDAVPLVASHDPRVVEITEHLADQHGRDDLEFQMLMGVRPLEQRRLVDIGLTCRTYVPFGPGWYEYLTTRIASRPRILWNYARAILDKR